MKKLLIIAQQWPEPATNAAGIRMMQLIDFFQTHHDEIHLACATPRNEYSIDIPQIITQEISLNDSSFDQYIVDLKPHTVIYDRFNVEEQYGWRLRENSPKTIQILDTEDLHFLRKAREKAFKQQVDETQFYQDDIALREIASMYRCDLSLIISEFEVELLQSQFNIPKHLLHYLPFTVRNKIANHKQFSDRCDFVVVGNLKHPPNKDAVLYLKNDIWPFIRKELPDACLNIYGAYADQQILQLHSEKTGFLIKGHVKNINEVVGSAKVMLAPLRYGAGLKGKLITAMQCDTPSIMTSIAAEGLYGKLSVPGFICDEPNEIAEKAVLLYTDENLWSQKSGYGNAVLEQRFNSVQLRKELGDKLLDLNQNIEHYRNSNFTGKLLQHHSMKSTKYLSKWIEEKNSNTKKSR